MRQIKEVIEMAEKKVLYNMKLFNGVSDRLQEGKMVLIEGGTITAVDDSTGLDNLSGYERINLEGSTLLPGLIDSHVHVTNSFLPAMTLENVPVLDKQTVRNCEACLDSGVTTIRDVGAIPVKIKHFRSKIESGKIKGPRILSSNSAIANLNGCPDWGLWPPDPAIIEALGGNRVVRPETPQEARRVVEEIVDEGADLIKIFRQSKSWVLYRDEIPIFDPESFQAIMDAAREGGKKVACHISWSKDFQHIIDMGVDTAEHSVLDELSDQTIQQFIEKDMAYIPTLVVPGAGDDNYWSRLNRFVDERGGQVLDPLVLQHQKGMIGWYLGGNYPPSEEEVKKNPMIDTSIFNRNYSRAQDNALRIHQAGGRVGVGTDCGGAPMLLFGLLYFEELKRMVDAGISNHDVLAAATSGNAKIIGMEDKIGRIEKGKWADLVTVKGDPLMDIEAMKDVQIVFKEGEIYHQVSA